MNEIYLGDKDISAISHTNKVTITLSRISGVATYIPYRIITPKITFIGCLLKDRLTIVEW